jgi:hypothetical protein
VRGDATVVPVLQYAKFAFLSVCTGYMTRLPSSNWLARQYRPVAPAGVGDAGEELRARQEVLPGDQGVRGSSKVDHTTVPFAP